jgi:hypothetical protein
MSEHVRNEERLISALDAKDRRELLRAFEADGLV